MYLYLCLITPRNFEVKNCIKILPRCECFFAQHSAAGCKMFKKHVKIVPKNCGWLKLYDTVLERERKKEGGKVQIISRVETSF
jgi:hypothetical protein